ncbi:MAG: hypothetical protein ABI184_09150 [Ginsengibacter sp.]
MQSSILPLQEKQGAVVNTITKTNEQPPNGVHLNNQVMRRYAMIRYMWQIPEADAVTGFFPWSDVMLRAIFTDENGWSVKSYWERATLGLMTFDVDLFPVHVLPLQENGQQNDRGGCISLMKAQAIKDGIPLQLPVGNVSAYDQVIAFILPPPSNAGAAGNPGDALFDENGFMEFYEHELGHVLGFQHSWGLDNSNNYGAYNDNYDIMGFTNPFRHSIPAAPEMAYQKLNSDFWFSGRRFAAAALYRYVPAFATSASVIRLSFPVQTQVTLRGLAVAILNQPILIVIATQNGEILVEYRPNMGDDLGVEPAIVIHSLGRRSVTVGASEVNPIFYEGRIQLPAGGTYVTLEGDVTISCGAVSTIPEFISITVEAGKFEQLPAAAGVPAMIQSRFGKKGNFEFVSPEQNSGLFFTARNNDISYLPWSDAFSFAENLGKVDAVSLIQSNYGTPGNLELIVRAGNQLNSLWRDSGPAFQWSNPAIIGTAGVSGNPVLLQSKFGKKGNFELICPLAAGGLVYYFRNNDDPQLPWSAPFVFAQNLGNVDAVTMIQSNYGNPGDMEVVVRVGNQLHFLWRDSGPAFNWSAPISIGQPGVSGNPVLIQSHFGKQGNFELVVPLQAGGLVLYWRNNDDPQQPWSAPLSFAQSLGQVQAVTMIESNYGTPGNFELIALSGSQLYKMYRDSSSLIWSAPVKMQSIS